MITVRTMKQIPTSRMVPSFRLGSTAAAQASDRGRIQAAAQARQASDHRRQWLQTQFRRARG